MNINTCRSFTAEQELSSRIMHLDSITTSDVFEGKSAIDGIYFRIEERPESSPLASLNFLRFQEKTVLEYNSDLETDCWLVLLFEPEGVNGEITSVVYYHCYIGDPITFARNHIKTEAQGLIVKKSVPGFKILLELLEKSRMGLDIVEEQISIDLDIFKQQHNL
jgi:hypothetical protein